MNFTGYGNCEEALIVGMLQPVLQSHLQALSLEDPQAAKDSTNLLCIAFLVLGVVVGLAAFLQTYLFNMAGVYLSTRVRSATLKGMVQQDCSWFDDTKNAVGALSVRLTADAASMQGVNMN